jgi:hypothetical protein
LAELAELAELTTQRVGESANQQNSESAIQQFGDKKNATRELKMRATKYKTAMKSGKIQNCETVKL